MISGVILAASVILAWILSWILGRIARKVDKDEKVLLDDLLRASRFPAAGIVIVVGIFAALAQFSATSHYANSWQKWFVAAATLLVVYGGSQAASLAIRWYVQSFADPTLVGHAAVYRKVVMLAIWIFAGVLILDQLGYRITTIVAGLGIAGLAVGLALQDTIANIFSGFYLMVDRSVRAGDYIKLDSGHEGFVEYVGWRNTKMRVWANNMVLIPNAKLIQSIITNYTLPSPNLSVYVFCGVSYDSDLEHVERVCLEVAREVLDRVPGSDLSFEPVIRFKEFADSNINFVAVMRSVDVASQYMLQHEFVKALHRRFKEEEIEISFPVRKLVFDGSQRLVPFDGHDAMPSPKSSSEPE